MKIMSAGREPVARATASHALSNQLTLFPFFLFSSQVTVGEDTFIFAVWRSFSSCIWEGDRDRSIRKQLAERDLISAIEVRKEWVVFAC